MKLSRRKFLGFTAGTVLIAGGAYMVASRSRPGKAPIKGLRYLSNHEAKVIETFMDDLFDPQVTGFPVKTEEVLKRIDEHMGKLDPFQRKLLKGGFFLLQQGTLFSRHIFTPYTKLTKPERLRYLKSWSESRFSFKRQIFVGLKMFTGLFVFSFPETNEFIGIVKECGL